MLETRCARVFLLAIALVCFAITATVGAAVAAEAPEASSTDSRDTLFDRLEYRFIGPVGNRVPAVAGVPGDPAVYYAGAASGGIFKTTDGGAHWRPVFDDHPVSSIGSLAVAPTDPNIVWAGTGETFLRANISIGDGIYRSTDAGEHWQRMGLEKTGRIGRVIVHPQDPDIVYAAALGSVYQPQQERGVYRTLDGGKTWERILFVDENTGASDLVMDPNNPRILFAGMWEISLNTWSRKSGGPGSGLWVTRDGGETWKRLEGDGLPKPPWGKIGLTMSADDSSRVYALIETSSNRDFAPIEEFQGVVWRSDDGGEEWSMVSANNDLVQRPLYYSRALASPDDRDEIYFMSVRHSTSLDGAKTSFLTENQPGWDHHDMWIDPENADRMIVGHDGGVSISINRTRSWLKPQLPIAQMYHVAVDQRVPYFVYGNRQDGPTTRGPSNNLIGEKGIPIGDWRPVGGCETGFAVPDPVETN
ncbi:MAG: sialidase, partial [Thermoanaerobaculia bacterium]